MVDQERRPFSRSDDQAPARAALTPLRRNDRGKPFRRTRPSTVDAPLGHQSGPPAAVPPTPTNRSTSGSRECCWISSVRTWTRSPHALTDGARSDPCLPTKAIVIFVRPRVRWPTRKEEIVQAVLSMRRMTELVDARETDNCGGPSGGGVSLPRRRQSCPPVARSPPAGRIPGIPGAGSDTGSPCSRRHARPRTNPHSKEEKRCPQAIPRLATKAGSVRCTVPPLTQTASTVRWPS